MTIWGTPPTHGQARSGRFPKGQDISRHLHSCLAPLAPPYWQQHPGLAPLPTFSGLADHAQGWKGGRGAGAEQWAELMTTGPPFAPQDKRLHIFDPRAKSVACQVEYLGAVGVPRGEGRGPIWGKLHTADPIQSQLTHRHTPG